MYLICDSTGAVLIDCTSIDEVRAEIRHCVAAMADEGFYFDAFCPVSGLLARDCVAPVWVGEFYDETGESIALIVEKIS